MPQWPERDPVAHDGLFWPRRGVRLPRPDVVRHVHVCPSGLRLVVHSQHVRMTGVTLDRWVIGELQVATSVRTTSNAEPPDFTWCDERDAPPPF